MRLKGLVRVRSDLSTNWLIVKIKYNLRRKSTRQIREETRKTFFFISSEFPLNVTQSPDDETAKSQILRKSKRNSQNFQFFLCYCLTRGRKSEKNPSELFNVAQARSLRSFSSEALARETCLRPFIVIVNSYSLIEYYMCERVKKSNRKCFIYSRLFLFDDNNLYLSNMFG